MIILNARDDAWVKDWITKNWVTHNAIWYGLCLHKLGAQQTNQLNKSATRMMAGVEMKRLLSLIGNQPSEKIQTFDELTIILEEGFQMIQTSFLSFNFSFPKKNMLICEFNDCYAFKGFEKFGMIDTYECSIVERIKGWLDRLGIKYVVRPDFKGCLMHQEGNCSIEVQFNLK